MNKKRFYSFITIVLISLATISCGSNDVPETTAAPVDAARLSESLRKADELFRKRENVANLREAVNALATVRNPDQRNYEVEWKYAKYSYFLGKQTDDAGESEKSLENGVEAGKIASRVEPEKPDGYFWYGANLGEQARRSPLTKGFTSIKDIQSAMNKVIALEPNYQGASAFDALAQIELSTGMVGGKPEKAVEYLEKAVKIEKDNSYIHLHLGKAYLAVDRDSDAKRELEYVVNMKPNPEFMPEYNESVEEARKLLDERF